MNAPVAHMFDIENARRLCLAAKAAYLPASDTLGVFRIEDTATDTVVLVDHTDTDIIVAFRGTANLRNWLTDLQCRLVPWTPNMNGDRKVHEGFDEAWLSVRDRLYACLEGIPNRTKNVMRVWFTGHSLGGDLAMLAAADQAFHDSFIVAGYFAGLYTFGQARVGNAKWRDWFNTWFRKWTHRVIHADDIVPRVPWLLGAYRHAGHEVFFPSGAVSPDFQIDPSTLSKLPSDLLGLWRELKPCMATSVLAEFWTAIVMRDWRLFLKAARVAKLALLNDHHIDLYVKLFPALTPEPCSLHDASR